MMLPPAPHWPEVERRRPAAAPQGSLLQHAVRAADVVVGLALLLLTLPVLQLAAIAVRLDGPGPVLRRTPYVGRGGRTILLLTFRCMVGGTRRGSAPHLSRLGGVLRLTRLDGLPVLLNLLAGDLTLLGPAPLPLAAGLARAPSCKPGLLGWCAVD